MKRTPTGAIVPKEEIYDLSDYSVKPDTKLGAWSPDQPVPRLESVTEHGRVTIVWDRKMVIPLDTSKIPTTRYVVYDEDNIVRVDASATNMWGTPPYFVSE